jgi:hypothetical protein
MAETKWATAQEIAAAEQAWPRDVPDEVHIRAIMRETGLSHDTAELTLHLCRGDTEGDLVMVTDAEPV